MFFAACNLLRSNRVVASAFALFLFTGMATHALAQAAQKLEVKGDLVKAMSFDAEDLARLPQKEISESRNLNSGNQKEHQKGNQKEASRVAYQGVLLRDVLNAAGFQEAQPHDARKALIVARARDGYIALFSWGELFNTEAGDNVLVITRRNGKPLEENEGPYALRSLGDVKTGPRHVKWLERIEVMLIR